MKLFILWCLVQLSILGYQQNAVARQNLKRLEINFDNYYAKIKIDDKKVQFKDPRSNRVVHISKCNRTAWKNLVRELETETEDYELLLNTNPPPRSNTDVEFKLNGRPMKVASQSSLGHWSKRIESRWEAFSSETEHRCQK